MIAADVVQPERASTTAPPTPYDGWQLQPRRSFGSAEDWTWLTGEGRDNGETTE